MTWFGFLHDFCCRPLLQYEMQIRGLRFAAPLLRVPRSQRLHFQEAAGRVCLRRLSLLLMHRKMMADIRGRLERNVDVLLIGEVQDFAGHDFLIFYLNYAAPVFPYCWPGMTGSTNSTPAGTGIPTSHWTITSPTKKPVLQRRVCCQTGKPSAKRGAAHRQYASLSHQICIYLSKHTYPVRAGLKP